MGQESFIKLGKLTSNDVRRCYVTGVEAPGLGGLTLEKSWEELIIALLVLLHDKNEKKFMSRLIESKVASRDFDVTPQEYIWHRDGITIKPVKIVNTGYFLYYDFSCETIPFKIRALFNLLDVNYKNVILELTPYVFIDQDDIQYGFNNPNKIRRYTLAETAYASFNNNILVSVEILGITYKCNTYLDLIAHILSYAARLDDNWYDIVYKHNNDVVLKLGRTPEEARVYDLKPREIPGTGCYINMRKNAECVMEYIRDICKEFNINTHAIILYCRDLDFKHMD